MREPDQPKHEERATHMQSVVQNSINRRGAFLSLAGVTAFVAISSGIVVTIVSPKDFQNVGDGVWWAIVTLATVGYGDIVPHTPWGRVVGSIVILFGVTFLAFLTALVTSIFVSAAQQAGAEAREDERKQDEAATRAMIGEVLERLDSIERRLGDPGANSPE